MISYTAAYTHNRETGWIMAQVLDFPGALSQGRDLTKARRMLADALRLLTESYLEDGERLPRPIPGITDPNADVVEPIQLHVRVRAGGGSP